MYGKLALLDYILIDGCAKVNHILNDTCAKARNLDLNALRGTNGVMHIVGEGEDL